MKEKYIKDWQYYKFCFYGFLKNQRFFEPFLILIFLREKGLSFTQIGTLYSIRFILRTLFEVPSGIAADALGRKGTMLFSYSFYMISFALYYMADTFSLLFLPTICFALGDAFRTGTHKAMIFEYLKKKGWQDKKVDYYGHTRSWSQVGSAISSLIAAGLVLIYKDFNIIFLYSLIPYIIGFFLLASYPAYLNGQTQKSVKPKKLIDDIIIILKTTFLSLIKLPNIKLTLNIASYSGFYNAAKDYLQIIIIAAIVSIPIIRDIRRTEDEMEIILIGAVYFILYFLTALASRLSGRIHRLFPSNAVFLNFFLLLGLGISIGAGLLSQYNLHIPALILFIGILIVENLRRPAGIAAIADSFDERIHASVLSAESQISSLIGAVISFLIGFAADRIGPGYAIALAGALIILAYPFFKLKNSRRGNLSGKEG